MQLLVASSFFYVATAKEAADTEPCDICQGREMPEGALTFDGHDCSGAVPFCEASPAACGGTCHQMQDWVGAPCCPFPDRPDGSCDICEGREVLEGVNHGEDSCIDAVSYCATNVPFCGGTCDELKVSIGSTCCKPYDGLLPDGSCDICQGREIPEGATTYDGHDCLEAVPFCAWNTETCGGTCLQMQDWVGAPCCPFPDRPDGICDICEGREVLEGVSVGESSCTDHVAFCSTMVPFCGGTCDELKVSIGSESGCCPIVEADPPCGKATETEAPQEPTLEPLVFPGGANPVGSLFFKTVHIDPRLHDGAHASLLTGTWKIFADGTYQTTQGDIQNNACDSSLTDTQAFTGLCECNNYTYGKCTMSVFYNLGAPCPSSNTSCGVAIPTDGEITISRAGLVYFQIADAFHDDNSGSLTLTIAGGDASEWNSGAVASAKAKITLFLVMVVSLLL